MTGIFKGAVAATLLAGSTLAAVAPAQADRGSGAVIAGIAGLAIGAAIASDHNRGYYGGYSGYYAEPTYYAAPAYYGGYGYAPSYAYGYGNAYGYRDGGRGRGDWGRGDWGRGRGSDRGWRDHDRHDRDDGDRHWRR